MNINISIPTEPYSLIHYLLIIQNYQSTNEEKKKKEQSLNQLSHRWTDTPTSLPSKNLACSSSSHVGKKTGVKRVKTDTGSPSCDSPQEGREGGAGDGGVRGRDLKKASVAQQSPIRVCHEQVPRCRVRSAPPRHL